MKWQCFCENEQMHRFVAERLRDALQINPRLLFCIAAGDTSCGLFRCLIDMERKGEIDFHQSRFVAMDEWKNMNESTPGSCSDFLQKHFLQHVAIPKENIRLVNGAAEELDAECAQIQSLLAANGGIDFLVLGCGMNGHLALNEPGTPETAGVHVTELDSVTGSVGQKYFAHAVELSGGVTIGLNDICKSKEVYLVVEGERKREILRKIMEEEITPELPATILRTLPQAMLVYDQDAGALLL